MANRRKKKPREHCRCCSKQDRIYRKVRWLGPFRAAYELARDHWPW